MKPCTICGVSKPLAEFDSARGYPQGRCKPCNVAYSRDYAARNRDAVRANVRRHVERSWTSEDRRRKRLGYQLKHAFGLSLVQFDAMVLAQGGKCAICGDVPVPGVAKNGHRRANSRLCVDHDHVTGAVRSLLCQPCNTAIGMLRDDPERCIAAAAYLRRHRDAAPIPAECGHEEAT